MATQHVVVDRAHENALIDAYNKEMVMRDYDNMELLQDVPDGVTGNFLEFVQDKKNIVPLMFLCMDMEQLDAVRFNQIVLHDVENATKLYNVACYKGYPKIIKRLEKPTADDVILLRYVLDRTTYLLDITVSHEVEMDSDLYVDIEYENAMDNLANEYDEYILSLDENKDENQYPEVYPPDEDEQYDAFTDAL